MHNSYLMLFLYFFTFMESCLYHIFSLSSYIFLISFSTRINLEKLNLIQQIIQCPRPPVHPFFSKTKHFREKRFRQKLFGFEGAIRWYHWFDLEESFEGHLNFFKWHPYFLLHILVADLESFPKHYN